MIGFIIGLFLGTFIGVAVMCLCNVASRYDEEYKPVKNSHHKKHS
jgi:hypothetical protein